MFLQPSSSPIVFHVICYFRAMEIDLENIRISMGRVYFVVACYFKQNKIVRNNFLNLFETNNALLVLRNLNFAQNSI